MLRDLMTLIQEAIEETEVETSHIQIKEHNGEKLYVHFIPHFYAFNYL